MFPIIARIAAAVAATQLSQPVFAQACKSCGDRGGSSGCQASRVSPNFHVDLSWFDKALKQAAVRFAHVPPIFVHNKD